MYMYCMHRVRRGARMHGRVRRRGTRRHQPLHAWLMVAVTSTWVLLLVAVLLREAYAAPSKLTLPSLLTNDAVLPAATPTIWGWALPGAKVTLAVAGAYSGSYSATASDTDGAWEVALKAVTPSLAESNISIKSGADELALQRVLFGELILCGGQVGAGLDSCTCAAFHISQVYT